MAIYILFCGYQNKFVVFVFRLLLKHFPSSKVLVLLLLYHSDGKTKIHQITTKSLIIDQHKNNV